MLYIFDGLCDKLPDFDAHLKDTLENKKTEYVEALSTKAVPMKEEADQGTRSFGGQSQPKQHRHAYKKLAVLSWKTRGRQCTHIF